MSTALKPLLTLTETCTVYQISLGWELRNSSYYDFLSNQTYGESSNALADVCAQNCMQSE